MTKKYRTIQGDTWDIISLRVYGDEHFVAELIAANYAHRAVVLFPAGVEINVPEVDTEAATSTLPPWKREASK